MASAQRRSVYGRENRIYSERMYVYGNAVPNPSYVPERQRDLERPRKRRTSSQVKRNRRNAMQISKSYVIFLSVAALCMMLCCVYYIQLRTELTSRSQHIAQMQQTLTALNEENTTRYNSVMDSVNLEDVRTKAMDELGMVYASQEQVIEYDNPTGDYIQQYESIPEEGVLASSLDADN